jgi:hypothetical protein
VTRPPDGLGHHLERGSCSFLMGGLLRSGASLVAAMFPIEPLTHFKQQHRCAALFWKNASGARVNR